MCTATGYEKKTAFIKQPSYTYKLYKLKVVW